MSVRGPTKEIVKHNNHRMGATRQVQCWEKTARINWRSSVEALPMLKPRQNAKKRRKAWWREAATPTSSKSTRKCQRAGREAVKG